MFSRKQSLAQARQFRACPPASIAENPEFDTSMKQHRAICPFCASGLPENFDQWERLVTGFPASVKKPLTKSVNPGQLRFIKTERAAWRDGYYYSPPLVLTLEIPTDIPGAVRVAQTFSDITLAGPGDLILDAEQTDAFPLFVQPWNIYTLGEEDLDGVIGELSSDIVADVLAMKNNPQYLPDWAMVPAPMTENDPRIFFREMEVEVGFTFAAPAVRHLMDAIESADPIFDYPSPTALRQALQRANPGLTWSADSVDMITDLISARFHDAGLPMAAKDQEDEIAIGKAVILKQGKVFAVDPLRIEIFDRIDSDKGFEIAGKILQPPAGAFSVYMACLAEAERQAPLLPDVSRLDRETHFFSASFSGPSEKYPTFNLTLLCDDDRE